MEGLDLKIDIELYLGLCYLYTDKYPLSIETLEISLKNSPKSVPTLEGLALGHLKSQEPDLEKAKGYLLKSIKLDPQRS